MASFNLPGRSAKAPLPEEKPKTVLEQRRDELRTTFTEMQWDLGGAAYEMAARDYFRLDVLAKMAARLQVVDAELAEIERITRLQEAGAAGACAGCGSLHARGAIYCWRCGRNVAQPQGSAMVLPAGTTTPQPQNGNGNLNGSGTGAPVDRAAVFSDTSVIDSDHRPGPPEPAPHPDPMAAHLPTEPPVQGSPHFFEPHPPAPTASPDEPDPMSAPPLDEAPAGLDLTGEMTQPENVTPLEDLGAPEDVTPLEDLTRPGDPGLSGEQPAR